MLLERAAYAVPGFERTADKTVEPRDLSIQNRVSGPARSRRGARFSVGPPANQEPNVPIGPLMLAMTVDAMFHSGILVSAGGLRHDLSESRAGRARASIVSD